VLRTAALAIALVRLKFGSAIECFSNAFVNGVDLRLVGSTQCFHKQTGD